MPAKPTSTATIRNIDGTRRTYNAVTTAVTSGRPPLIIPVIDELTVLSAIGYSRNGAAIHSAASRTNRGQSRRSMRRRAVGNKASTMAPNAQRPSGTTPASTWSMAMAIHRNELPHIAATAAVMPHSLGPK